ncbi:alpha 1,3-glucosidase [Tremella mesenterica]|uniref:Glucosidase II subunit alpha n=1 Tax=Tremella mesenterica TaxID=5217 RepID=A0A4Q1BV54_TREME|nr:alpha 1,3-glucosidase [Tremella mesenterica]
MSVKQEDFKLCSQSSFCRRLRSIGAKQATSPAHFRSPYAVGKAIQISDSPEASWAWPLKSALYPEISFELRIDVLEGDVVRIRADEVRSKTPFRRYNESAKWALLKEDLLMARTASIKHTPEKSIIKYGKDGKLVLEVQHKPFKIIQSREGKPMVIMNERGLFHMEHFRVKEVEAGQELLSEGEQMVIQNDNSWFEESDKDMFEETWKKWTDSKPKGPEALSIDLTFPGVQHVFGLPEHASPLSLPDTIGTDAQYSEPYRLFNVDIFEYLADSPMSLYGAIPLLHAVSKSHAVGVLNLIASDTWVDVLHTKAGVQTHWMSESGILDLFILPGPTPDALFEQYAALTGPTPLPPQWSIGYHQCRWNYNDEPDVLGVQAGFDEADMPLDVTWLDIEYAEEHRYFDWDPKHFPDPVRMLDAVAEKGRKMVAIVDPHIKKTDSFRIYSDAKELDILVKKSDGSNFEGWCWTGSSVWVDFFNPKSWDWWMKMFGFSVWKESSPALFIWNDMNEPSVFDGPEISVPRDTLFHGGWENRDLHNINGMMFHRATAEALIARESPAKRPFVLSRSFFAGSQRYGAIWTGDNMGTWDHFAGETAMILSNNIAGMSFCGADVGGFFGNPTPELLVRWYQAGAFMPFFRAHAHIDTKRREPYLYEEPIRGYLRDVLRMRYKLLPVWYNAFHEASIRGSPIIKPQYAVFPHDEAGFAIDDQYYIGSSGLLFKPITVEGATTTTVYLSAPEPYYNYHTSYLYPSSSSPRRITLSTPLETYPLLVQGGHIVPTRERVRRASSLMWQDPFTLLIALDKEGKATGELYLDDGVGYDYQSGDYVWRKFEYVSHGKSGSLKSTRHEGYATSPLSTTSPVKSEGKGDVKVYQENNKWAQAISHVRVERIIVLGLKTAPKMVRSSESTLEFTWEDGVAAGGKKEGRASRLVIKNPGVGVVNDWVIVFE